MRLNPLLLTFALFASSTALSSGPGEWRSYGNGSEGTKYSALEQVTPRNVGRLRKAWTFHTGHLKRLKELGGAGEKLSSPFQATPLMVDGTLYFCDPLNRVFALNAATGRQKWMKDPVLQGLPAYAYHCRGVSYWQSSTRRTGTCSRRILEGTLDARLIALDAETGEYCRDFGNGGSVDLKEGMGDLRPGEYGVTSPPTVVGNLAITGSLVSDDWRKSSPAGVVRAYHVETGRLVWAWNATADQQRQENAQPTRESGRWVRGTPNAWSIFSVDEQLGLVYIPTGNPGLDVYGADRHGSDRYGSSVVALSARTGRLVWSFQTVHHDLWDYDVPAQPVLYNQRVGGHDIPALAIATKMGHIFLLDRRDGSALFPVEERPVPASTIPEELGEVSRTQPFPTHPEPLYKRTGQQFLARSTCLKDYLKEKLGITSFRNEGIFTPPSEEGTVVYPGPAGGTNWGGISISPNGLALTQLANIPFVSQLIRKSDSFVGLPDGTGEQTDLRPNLEGAPYSYHRFVSKSLGFLPCIGLPVNEIVAIDLTSGRTKWRRAWGGPITGTPGTGGILQTGSGLGFVGNGYGRSFVAVELATGRKLWDTKVESAIVATPMTYERDGEQYVVVAVGGNGSAGIRKSDSIVAFKLGR